MTVLATAETDVAHDCTADTTHDRQANAELDTDAATRILLFRLKVKCSQLTIKCVPLLLASQIL